MAKNKSPLKDIFQSEWFCAVIIIIAILIATLEIIALLKGLDGTMFGATMAGLGGLGGFLMKGFLGDSKK